MHILLVEPSPARRQKLALLLTSTGGFRVTSLASLNPAASQIDNADLLMISQRLYQPPLISIPCILFDAHQQTDISPPVIGCIPTSTAEVAISEQVRGLWEQH